MTGRGSIDGARTALFVATGFAVPLYAFPPLHALGRPVDLATLLAAVFVVSSVPAYRESSTPIRFWFVASALVPALALIRPLPPVFDLSRFLVSYGHWLLLIAFFFSSFTLQAPGTARRRIASWNVTAGTLVALFAIYQVVGTPRHWPATGPILVPFQREPLRLTWIGGILQEGSYTRPSSVFLEPSWMGGYLSWILVLGIAAVILAPGEARSKPRALAILALTAILLAIAASVSWGAYADLAAGVGAGVASLWLGRRRLPAGRILAATAVAALVVALAFLSPPGRRMTGAFSERWERLGETPLKADATETQQKDSSWLRARNLAHTSRLFRARALRGIGLGQFAGYSKSGDPREPSFENPWCGWIAIAAEMGVLGPMTLLACLLIVLRRWLRRGSAVFGGFAVPALLAVAVVQQLHTASFLDLWWWYPVSVACVLSAGPSGDLG